MPIILYCRAGFEKECAAEIQDKAAQKEVYGYVKAEAGSAYVIFDTYEAEHAEQLIDRLDFSTLIFARQWFVGTQVCDMDVEDRISPIVEICMNLPKCGRLFTEVADTNEGKTLNKFTKKFAVPLRQKLRKVGKLTELENTRFHLMHVFFTKNDTAWVGYSIRGNHSDDPMGIMRLRLPSKAPSRSTLKLDEAFLQFVTTDLETRLAPGLNAVDLGAAPGGWTYQLVKRGMFVHAVDNGPMQEELMDSGQVKHFQLDGFVYEPKRKNVYWLVCDMVEKPAKVTALICEWFAAQNCQEAIFNLKLPMKKRYESVTLAIQHMQKTLAELQGSHVITAKQLYHDREEVTVHVRYVPPTRKQRRY